MSKEQHNPNNIYAPLDDDDIVNPFHGSSYNKDPPYKTFDIPKSIIKTSPPKKPYNTDEGIQKSLVSLEEFHKLINERHAAGYERHEPLDDFTVLDGEYWLDTCGNVWQRSKGDNYVMPSTIAPLNIECNRCKDTWTIENVADVVKWEDDQVITISDFIGKPLMDLVKNYQNRTDALYRINRDRLIRNDTHIDTSLKYPDTEDEWEKTIVKNKNGWLGAEDGITPKYVIQEGDESYMDIWKFYHKSCNETRLEEEFGQKFEETFKEAGFKDIKLNAIKNKYCPDEACGHCAPWFEVDTEYGSMTIGWRKRVISIDWVDSDMKSKIDASGDIFKDEDVTKCSAGIHAWGWDKAKDYLSRIHTELVNNE
ncbi:MAG: hypothetical protein KJ906_04135 [Nanoarchaeota archaeon]|nr:hypothetical protein [Nanoarchaeota archaeon]